MHSTTQNSLENFPPCSRASFSHLGRHDTGGPVTPVRPVPCTPSPQGPPVFVWRRRAAAAGLGPLAGYCRRIYCIAACAGCSPAHNRLAVAQGSTLRGKEGGIHPAADCRAFAAVSCRIRTLAPDTPAPCSSLARGPRELLQPPPHPLHQILQQERFWWPHGLGDTLLVPCPHLEVRRGCSPRWHTGGHRGPPRWVHKAGAGREPGTASSTN